MPEEDPKLTPDNVETFRLPSYFFVECACVTLKDKQAEHVGG